MHALNESDQSYPENTPKAANTIPLFAPDSLMTDLNGSPAYPATDLRSLEGFPVYDRPLPDLSAGRHVPDVDLTLSALRRFRERMSPPAAEAAPKKSRRRTIGAFVLSHIPEDMRTELEYASRDISQAKSAYHLAREQYPAYPSIANMHARRAAAAVQVASRSIAFQALDKPLEQASIVEHGIRDAARKLGRTVAAPFQQHAAGHEPFAFEAPGWGKRIASGVASELDRLGDAAGRLLNPAPGLQLSGLNDRLEYVTTQYNLPAITAHTKAEVAASGPPLNPAQAVHKTTLPPRSVTASAPITPAKQGKSIATRFSEAWQNTGIPEMTSLSASLILSGPWGWALLAYIPFDIAAHTAKDGFAALGRRVGFGRPKPKPTRPNRAAYNQSTYTPPTSAVPYHRPYTRNATKETGSKPAVRHPLLSAADLTYAIQLESERADSHIAHTPVTPPFTDAYTPSGHRTIGRSWSQSRPRIPAAATAPQPPAAPARTSPGRTFARQQYIRSAYRPYVSWNAPKKERPEHAQTLTQHFIRYAYLTPSGDIDTFILSGFEPELRHVALEWEKLHPTSKRINMWTAPYNLGGMAANASRRVHA